MGKTVWPEIMAEVDGRPLALIAREYETYHEWAPASPYAGLCPIRYRFGPWDHYFHGYRTIDMSDTGKVALLTCDCYVVTCWPLLATVATDFETVVWKNFEQPHRSDRDYSGLGPFVFNWRQYEDAVIELQQHVVREFLPEASE